MKLFLKLFVVFCVISIFVTLIFDEQLQRVNTFVIARRPTIVIDAGHGGFDGGAVAGEVIESHINLQFALKMETLLKAFGYDVVMTRSTDTGTEDAGLSTIRQKKVSDIRNRIDLVQSTSALMFISFHQNMYKESKYSGAQVFFSPNNEQSAVLAQNIQNSVRENVQPENDREIKESYKGIYLMHRIDKPAVMVECGFMSNEDELKNLQSEDYQRKFVFSVLLGMLTPTAPAQ